MLRAKMREGDLKYYVENLFTSLPKPKSELVSYLPTGNSEAEILILAPPSGKEDYKAGRILASPQAELFFEILRAKGFNPTKDFLYLPTSRFGIKPTKAATKDVLPILIKLVKKKEYRLVVCLGGGAYSQVFTSGLKSKVHTIYGNVVYMPSWLGKTPVTVLPEIEPLLLPLTGRDTDWRLQRNMKEHAEKLSKFIDVMKSFLL